MFSVVGKFYFILFYFILFYFILFYFILFYFILFYFILFYFIFFFFLFFFLSFNGLNYLTRVIEHFGREKLREGSGVGDVAGGQSEFAFQLVNLNGIPVTVMDPRPYSIEVRKNEENFYFFSSLSFFFLSSSLLPLKKSLLT